MASSAAFLSEFKSDLQNDFPGIKFPFYNSTGDLLSITKRLLNDTSFREDYVLQCNHAIDKGFRWHHRFQLIGQVTGVDLTSATTRGSYQRLDIKGYNDFMDFERILKKVTIKKAVMEVLLRITHGMLSIKMKQRLQYILGMEPTSNHSELYE